MDEMEDIQQRRCSTCSLPSVCEIYQAQGDGNGRLPAPCGGILWMPMQRKPRGRYKLFAFDNPDEDSRLPLESKDKTKRRGPMGLRDLDDITDKI